MVGFGWDLVFLGGGFFSKLFGGGGLNIDCDVLVLMLENGKFIDKKNIIYFGNLKSCCGSVRYIGDNLIGDGVGDDE